MNLSIAVTTKEPANEQEELLEAQAHGFETVAEFYDWMVKCYEEAEQD